MVGRPAGDHDDPRDAGEDRLVERVLLVEVDAVAARGAIEQRVRDGVGLFVDLLEHERVIAALLGGLLIPVDRLHGALELLAGGRHDLHSLRAQHDDLAVLQILDLAGLGEKAGDRGGDELLALATADDQRALLARSHQHLRLVETHRDERVVALQLGIRGAHGIGEIVDIVGRDQVGDHLGVSL